MLKIQQKAYNIHKQKYHCCNGSGILMLNYFSNIYMNDKSSGKAKAV